MPVTKKRQDLLQQYIGARKEGKESVPNGIWVAMMAMVLSKPLRERCCRRQTNRDYLVLARWSFQWKYTFWMIMIKKFDLLNKSTEWNTVISLPICLWAMTFLTPSFFYEKSCADIQKLQVTDTRLYPLTVRIWAFTDFECRCVCFSLEPLKHILPFSAKLKHHLLLAVPSTSARDPLTDKPLRVNICLEVDHQSRGRLVSTSCCTREEPVPPAKAVRVASLDGPIPTQYL